MLGHVPLIAAAVLLAAAMLLAPSARANAPDVTTPWLVSGPDPLPDVTDPTHCEQADGTVGDRHGMESEATLAVNPTNPANLVAAWMQSELDAIVVGSSFDAGRTWMPPVIPPTSKCTPGGGPYENTQDPWLAFGPADEGAPDGRLYLSSLVGDPDPLMQSLPDTVLVVQTSVDGGRSWEPSQVDTASLDTDDAIIGSRPRVVADPNRPGRAYVVWKELTPIAFVGKQYVAYTTDGGENWSDPLLVPPDPRPCVESDGEPKPCLPAGGELLVLGDGSLVDVFVEVPSPAPCTIDDPPPGGTIPKCPTVIPGPTRLAATRLSNPTNPASTWSPPVTIEDEPFPTAPVLPGIALAPNAGENGTIHVSWQQFLSPARDPAPSGCILDKPCLRLTDYRSTDLGQTWTSGAIGDFRPGRSQRYGGSCCLSAPAVAVADDGTVGVAFYDHRRDTAYSTDRRITDFWFNHSHDGGSTWSENFVAGTFDQAESNSPYPGIGEYQGIAAIPGAGFATAYTLSKPYEGFDANFALGTCAPDEINPCIPTDIFFTYVGDPASDLALTNTAAPDPVSVGELLTYTLEVTNNGPSSAGGVILTDLLSKNTRLRSARSDHGRCVQRTPRKVECNLAELARGETATVTIVVRPTRRGMIVNTATTHASNVIELKLANNEAPVTTEVTP